MTTNLNADVNDLDLEYRDIVKDPNDPGMRQIDETVPTKYKDKSVDDLINMHVNLEKVLARQGSEVGQLRKIVDTQTQLINKAIAPNQQTEVKRPEVNAERLLNDPVSAVNSVVEANPQFQNSNQRLNQLEVKVKENEFLSKNPTYREDVQSPEFQEWVMASKVRPKLLVALHNYNFEAGEELWELWSEHKGAKEASEAARVQRISSVSTVRPGTGEQRGKPTYSRAKLAELQAKALRGDPASKARWEDPEFQREYMLAYAEERVR